MYRIYLIIKNDILLHIFILVLSLFWNAILIKNFIIKQYAVLHYAKRAYSIPSFTSFDLVMFSGAPFNLVLVRRVLGAVG